MSEGIKREFRIDSSDSARPQATLESETKFFAQGLKPKPRVIVKVEYEPLDEFTLATKTSPAGRLILRTATYNDGVTVDSTVGEKNEGYQQHLLGIKNEGTSAGSTRLRQPKAKTVTPKAPKKG